MSMEFGWGRETFSFAIALQNLLWGASQPFLGALADRHGAMRVTITCALLYSLGLALMTVSSTGLLLSLSAGVIVGIGAAGVTFATIFGVIGRTFPPEQRSNALGIASAVGSFGQFVMAPVDQLLISYFGWSGALLIMAGLSLAMIPLAFGLRADSHRRASGPQQSIAQALSEAFLPIRASGC